jgi:hypothetical protein
MGFATGAFSVDLFFSAEGAYLYFSYTVSITVDNITNAAVDNFGLRNDRRFEGQLDLLSSIVVSVTEIALSTLLRRVYRAIDSTFIVVVVAPVLVRRLTIDTIPRLVRCRDTVQRWIQAKM